MQSVHLKRSNNTPLRLAERSPQRYGIIREQDDIITVRLNGVRRQSALFSDRILIHNALNNIFITPGDSLLLPKATYQTMDPAANDVLSGRGTWFNQHPGNKRFRRMLEEKKVRETQLALPTIG